MTLVARLTWQVAEPSSFAGALAARLGVEALPGGLVPEAWTIDLGSAWLEVRSWLPEGPNDRPTPAGRLVLEPVGGGESAPEEGRPDADAPPLRLAGIGWATVELDRAEDELAMWLGERREPVVAADPHLGATVRLRGSDGLPGDAFVLLEPNTEGRLAASLARDGEGPCALYLRPAAGLSAWLAGARARGVTVSTRRRGPLGTQLLLVGGGVAGPHLVIVDGARGAGTIAP